LNKGNYKPIVRAKIPQYEFGYGCVRPYDANAGAHSALKPQAHPCFFFVTGTHKHKLHTPLGRRVDFYSTVKDELGFYFIEQKL